MPELTECLYCFNLDHWVPTSHIDHKVECKRCDVCPMWVPLWEWEEHAGHASSDGEELSCWECPFCVGFIKPTEIPTQCFFCSDCHSYIPQRLSAVHECACDPTFE